MANPACNQSLQSIYSISSNCTIAEDILRKHHYPNRVCFIGEFTCDMPQAAKTFNLSMVTSETGAEYIHDDQTLLVFSCFESEAFDKIMHLKLPGRIMGAPAFLEAADKQIELPLRARPILSLTMKDVVVCFTGIRDRSEAMELMYMVRCMGGSVRQEPDRRTTHLIANTTLGWKYEYANTFRVPAMSPEWVHQCWKKRYLPGFHATDEELMAYRQKPFIDCHAAFLGFSANEELVAMKMFACNGGRLTHLRDLNCTHLIIDDHTKCTVPDDIVPECCVVRSEWMWTCVQQIMRVPEDSYKIPLESLEKRKTELRKRQLQSCGCSFEDKENSNCCATDSANAGYSCISAVSKDTSEYEARPAKLKKIETSISGIQALDQTPPKIEYSNEDDFSSVDSAKKNSLSSESRATSTPEEKESTPDIKSSTPDVKSSTCRRSASFLELLQTEENYVKILETILGIKEEVMNNEQPGGALLTETEAKVIFCNVTPIFEAHRAILQDLRSVQRLWQNSPSIGDIYTEISSDLSKAYTPFVSTFEEAREMVNYCDEKKPRFHAFTKILRTRPECGRQALPDLMIRPVQRLGSTVLLLREIKKNTSPNHPDFMKLQSALESLSEVLSVINEDKRKMETLCRVFDVFNLIEYCPPDIIASHRSLTMQIEAIQLTEDGPAQIGDYIMLFIFTDVVLLAKKKSKVVAMNAKPSKELTDKILKLTHGKPYKFLEVIPHTSVRRLLNIVDNQNVRNVFTLVIREQDELRERHCSFRLVEGIGDKSLLLESWCRALASHTCTADPNSYLMTISPEECGIASSDVEKTQMQKASRIMVKTQCLLGSVFTKGASSKSNKTRTPSFNVHQINPDAVRSPSCSNLTDEMVFDEKTQGLKTSSLTHNLATKI